MFYNMAEVQIIKLAVWNLEGLDNSSRDALLGSISWLTDKYKRTEDKEYLIKAVWHIYAYIELGQHISAMCVEEWFHITGSK